MRFDQTDREPEHGIASDEQFVPPKQVMQAMAPHSRTPRDRHDFLGPFSSNPTRTVLPLRTSRVLPGVQSQGVLCAAFSAQLPALTPSAGRVAGIHRMRSRCGLLIAVPHSRNRRLSNPCQCLEDLLLLFRRALWHRCSWKAALTPLEPERGLDVGRKIRVIDRIPEAQEVVVHSIAQRNIPEPLPESRPRHRARQD